MVLNAEAACAAVKPDQENACCRTPARVHQFAKVVIFSYENPFFVESARQHLVVGGAFCDFRDSNHVMTRFA